MSRWKNNFLLRDKRGLTLLEVVVAAGIISFGLAGSLLLINFSSRNVRTAEYQLIASYLAQESVEIVIGIRDSNWLAGRPWDQGLSTMPRGVVDFDDTSISQVSSSRFCLRFDSATDTYTHGTSSTCNTPYRRHIEISYGEEEIDDEDVTYMDVRVIVEWTESGERERSVTVSHRLYDWYE